MRTCPKTRYCRTARASSRTTPAESGISVPLPPPGKVHHYVFTLYALDQELNPVGDKAFLLSAMQGHIVGEGKLTGTYKR